VQIGSNGSATLNVSLGVYGSSIFIFSDSIRHVIIPPITSVEENRATELPKVSYLYQNFPNPFNPSTTFQFDLPKQDEVKIRVYNVLGKEIAEITNGVYSAGTHQVIWDGRTYSGIQASSGVYFVRFEAGGLVDTKKIMLMK
jgi:hypothetical protein